MQLVPMLLNTKVFRLLNVGRLSHTSSNSAFKLKVKLKPGVAKKNVRYSYITKYFSMVDCDAFHILIK